MHTNIIKICYYYIHFYCITTFEIFFFIYYISCLETRMFNNFIDSMLDNRLNFINKDTVNQYMSNNNITISYTKNCDDYLNELNNYNNELFMKCINFVIISSSVLFLLFLYDIYYTNLQKNQEKPLLHRNSIKKKIKSEGDLRLHNTEELHHFLPRNIRNNRMENFDIIQKNPIILAKTLDLEQDKKLSTSIQIYIKKEGIIPRQNKKNMFVYKLLSSCYFYTKKSKFIKYFSKSIKFITLIGIFEYFFLY